VCFFRGSYICSDDYVTVYALRNGSGRPRLLRRFCGSDRGPVFAQLGGIRVRFISDASISNRGFVANFFISRQSLYLGFPEGSNVAGGSTAPTASPVLFLSCAQWLKCNGTQHTQGNTVSPPAENGLKRCPPQIFCVHKRTVRYGDGMWTDCIETLGQKH